MESDLEKLQRYVSIIYWIKWGATDKLNFHRERLKLQQESSSSIKSKTLSEASNLQDVYSNSESKYDGYQKEIVEEEDEIDTDLDGNLKYGGNHPAFRSKNDEAEEEKKREEESLNHLRETRGSGKQNTKIADRETEYQRQGKIRNFERTEGESYKDRMQQQMLEKVSRVFYFCMLYSRSYRIEKTCTKQLRKNKKKRGTLKGHLKRKAQKLPL